MKHSPPIEDGQVSSCNCTFLICFPFWSTKMSKAVRVLTNSLINSKGSICHANGYLMVYPLETNINWISGKDNMTSYSFGPERIAHSFCPTCGTSVSGKSTDPNFFADNRAVNVCLLHTKKRDPGGRARLSLPGSIRRLSHSHQKKLTHFFYRSVLSETSTFQLTNSR